MKGSERKEGFYWVKSSPKSEPFVARWCAGTLDYGWWETPGGASYGVDGDLLEVVSKRLAPPKSARGV